MSRTNSQASFPGKVSKKKYAVIISFILTIVIGHFLIQLSFIESENQRIVESLAKTPPIEQNSLIPVHNEPVAPSESEGPRADVVLPGQPLATSKNNQTVKIVNREPVRRVQTLSSQNPLKRELKRDARSERLRRAEKILTGF